MAALNSFPPGAFPEYKLDCRQQTNRVWHCSTVKEQWVGFMEFGVICNNEDYNKHARNYAGIDNQTQWIQTIIRT